MTGEQLYLSPAESGDLYTNEAKLMAHAEKILTGVITSGGRPIKIHVRGKAKQRYKRHVTGRKTPYGTQTKHHYMVLECPHCFHLIVSLRRVRHTYKSLYIWLTKAFEAKRTFRFPKPEAPDLYWWEREERRCAISTSKK